MAEGAKARVGVGFESAPMVQATAFRGLRFASLTFKPDPMYERTRNMQQRPMLLKARVSKISLPWSVSFDPSVDDLAYLCAHHQGFAAITNPAASVYDWALRDLLDGDVLASPIETLSIDGTRDDGYAQLLLGATIRDMDIKVQSNKVVQASFSGFACDYTFMQDATLTTDGGTYTGKVRFRGNRQDADAEDIVNHLKLKCTTPGALDGTAKVKTTKGATPYGSTEIAITAGVWYEFHLADGSPASGDPYNPIEFMLTAGGTLSLNDEAECQAKRPAPTLSYPGRQPLHANGLRITIGGTRYIVENFDVKFTRPRKEQRGTGRIKPYGWLPDGNRIPTFTIQRDYVTRDLFNKMQSGTPVAFDATLNGDVIATAAGVTYFEKFQVASANAQVLKAGADPTNDKQLQETGVTIVPYFDGTNVDYANVIRCTLPTLAA